MSYRDSYTPASASAKLASTEGENWTFILAKQLGHPPAWSHTRSDYAYRSLSLIEADR